MSTQNSTRPAAGLVLIPSKLKQLRRIGPASDGVFESLSNDPHCRLLPRRADALRILAPGNYDVVAIIVGIHGSVLGPEIHVDQDGAEPLRVPMSPQGNGVFIARVSIGRPITGLRLDPTNRNGKLVLGPVWIQPRLADDRVGPVPAPLRALLKLVDWTVPASAARCRAKAALLVRAAGQDHKRMRFVSFEGGGEALKALGGRHIDLFTGDAAEATRAAAEGLPVRILAVLAPARLPRHTGRPAHRTRARH